MTFEFNVNFSVSELESLYKLISSFEVKPGLDQLLTSLNKDIEYLKKKELTLKTVSEGKTTISESKFGVHATHCCKVCGCKYNNEDCPVVMKLVEPIYRCSDYELHYNI